MDLHTPFHITLKEFKIDGQSLSKASGVREATISEFRHGRRAIKTDSLQKLLAAMPLEAQQFYFLNCFGLGMDEKSIPTLLFVIANKIREGAEPEAEAVPEYEDDRIPA
jgi:transcriptional regulator with XRE-family HTH domain